MLLVIFCYFVMLFLGVCLGLVLLFDLEWVLDSFLFMMVGFVV